MKANHLMFHFPGREMFVAKYDVYSREVVLRSSTTINIFETINNLSSSKHSRRVIATAQSEFTASTKMGAIVVLTDFF